MQQRRYRTLLLAGRTLLLLAGFLWSAAIVAQTAPPATRMDTIPHFKLDLVNGETFTKAQLKPHKPVMFVYFSPDCDHCQHFAEALAPHLDQFKGTQIVMVTFLPVAKLAHFAENYHLDKPFITIGTEGFSFVVRNYFGVQNFPFIALFDKHGKLVEVYKTPPTDVTVLSKGLMGKAH